MTPTWFARGEPWLCLLNLDVPLLNWNGDGEQWSVVPADPMAYDWEWRLRLGV